jgi:hypothetical protein
MDSGNNKPSCSKGLTRKEFLEKVVKRALVAGVVVVAADQFSVFRPAPALAQASGGPTGQTGPIGP